MNGLDDALVRALIAAVFVGACGGSAPPSPATPAPSDAPSTAQAGSAPESTPPASSSPGSAAGEEKPVPPLSGAAANSPDVAQASGGPSSAAMDASPQPPPAGGADDAALRRVAERAQECYAYSVSRDLPPGARGTLRVDVGIGPSGNVVDAAVRPSASTKELMGGRFEQCVVDAARRERFAPSRGGEERWLLAPFEFSPPP